MRAEALPRLKTHVQGMVNDIAWRELTEELKAREKFLQAVIDGVAEPIMVIGNDYHIRLMNKAAREHVEGSFGKPLLCHEISHNSEASCTGREHPCPLKLVSESMRPVSVVHVHYKGERSRIYDILASPFLGPDGSFQGIIESIRDITEYREPEESTQLLRRAIETIGVGITITDENRRIVFTNRAEAEMHGYTVEELIGKDSRIFASPEARTTHKDMKISEMGHFSGESLNVRKDGTVFPVSITSVPVGGAGGRPVALISACSDITERRKFEGALRESECRFKRLSQEFRTLLNAIPDRLVLLSPGLEVLWANEAVTGMLGDEAVDIPGVRCHALLFGNDSVCGDCPAKNSFQSGKEEHSRLEVPDGRLYDCRTFPIMNDEGEVANVIELSIDITEKVRLQDEASRSARLASLGELSAGVAHEINNPINTILLNARIIQRKQCLEGKEADVLNNIISACGHITGIVKSLLFFSRAESTEKTSEKISGLLSEALVLTRHLMRKEDVDLRAKVPEHLPEVTVNKQQMVQVFVNMIMNACQALNEKDPGKAEGKVLEVKAGALLFEGVRSVRITFRDHGIGMSAETMERAMDPFFTTKPPGEGTGLGLSISHGIVSEHGGRLFVESKENEYTKVAIFLPAGDGQ